MKPGLTIVENRVGSVQVLKISGFLDGHTAVELEHKLGEVLKGGVARLVLDLSALTYIASAGVGVLINVQHQAKKTGGGMTLVNPSPSVREIFSILGLEAILSIYASVDEGIQAATK